MRKRMTAAVALVLVGIGAAGMVVLDPFAGSGGTVTYRTRQVATTDVVQRAETSGTIVAAQTYQLAFGSDPVVTSATGSRITIGGIPFTVVGILQEKGSSGASSSDDEILIPVSTMKTYFSGSNTTSVRSIGVSVASRSQTETVKALITATLRDRHNLASTQSADFTVADQTQLIDTASSVSGTLSLLLGGIASISLIVGGIGIMNIMLVSVRERTREIGIRKAIGARNRDILLQLLTEALAISLLGGFIGVVIGMAVSAVIGAIAGWGFVFSPVTLLAATFFSLVVGVVFGVWPARQAAQLNPIAALRYE